jgi:hypothetical protein
VSFAPKSASARWAAFFIQFAPPLGGPEYLPLGPLPRMNMTATITPSATLTAFDHAFAAAIFCGWPERPAFDACVVMRAAGMSDREIELAFLDARKRIQ